jgi:NhaP-type Na+/H+ or K+/H+ antiporter
MSGCQGGRAIAFAALGSTQLPREEADFVVNVNAATVLLRVVLLSVVLHGVSAEPVARRFVRHPQPRGAGATAGSGR